jgi:flagellar biogenesis protein FliO
LQVERSAFSVRRMFMLHPEKLASGALLVLLLAAQSRAENTPPPPDWRDGQRDSVYLAQKRDPPAQQPATFSVPPLSTPLPRNRDALVKQTSREEAAPADSGSRHLAPPSTHVDLSETATGRTASMPRRLADIGLPLQSAYSMITALAIVKGAFLLFAWALRRGGKTNAARRGVLPTEVVDVLGRVPLAARQFAQLLRVGNKLVLVAVTPDGPTTLTEVTDPTEVDRLVGLCQQMDAKSTTKIFEQVFQQFTTEPVGGGFLGSDKLPTSIASAASAYRSHRGPARA